MKTPADFYKEFNGKIIDYDGAYGCQCVDLFRAFLAWADLPSIPTPNNYADGYYLDFDKLEIKPYFDRIGRPFKNGDWVIWKRGSASHPKSHIAMYFNDYELGTNQGGDGGACLKKTDFIDALGALRLKRWAVDGWKKEGRYWYYYANGEMLRSCTVGLIWKNKLSDYMFNSEGHCVAKIDVKYY